MFGGSKKTKWIIGGILSVVGVAVLLTIVILTSTGKNKESDVTRFWGPKFSSDSLLGSYEKGAVSTNGAECAQIGADILMLKNGSAMDAAIAALLCEGIVSSHSMGLGGGFLMTIWDAKNNKADYLDARETAPLDADKDMFGGNASASVRGGKSIAVPGELLGYWEAHKKYGKLKWSELFQPAIKLCSDGFLVNEYLATSWARKISLIRAEPTMAEIFINPNTNFTWTVGDKVRRPVLKKTLQALADAEDPIQLFYNGTMGQDLIREIQAFGGIMTMKDLQTYRVKWKTPIKSKRGDLTMYTAPPPGSGVILCFIMNLLRDLVPTANETVFWQRIIEGFKWAYARRTELADPDFEDITNLVTNLTSQSYADQISKKIKDDWTSVDPKYYGTNVKPIQDSGTAHISVLAPDGSAVSVTSTINQVFGSMRRSRSWGIIFNDEMDDFSSPNITSAFDLPPSPENFIKPGKRPLSSMAPTIIVDENNKVRLVIGAAGGTKITTAIAATMILNLWCGYSVKEAIDARRLHHQIFPMSIHYEPHFNETILMQLHRIGHNSTSFTDIGSAMIAIAQSNGIITANSDYRRQGKVAGF